MNVKINPEANEVSEEDLQAAAEYFDNLADKGKSMVNKNEYITLCDTCHLFDDIREIQDDRAMYQCQVEAIKLIVKDEGEESIYEKFNRIKSILS